MNLLRAIPIQPQTRLAFLINSTNLEVLAALARQVERPLLLVIGGQLDASQIALADHHFPLDTASDLVALRAALPAGITLLTGPLSAQTGQFEGLSRQLLDATHQLALEHHMPLLLAARAIRHFPPPAYARRQLYIPDHIDILVAAADVPPVKTITKEVLLDMLADINMGIKDRPQRKNILLLFIDPGCSFSVIDINQWFRQQKTVFDDLILAKLSAQPGSQVMAVCRRTAAVILAAGASERLGQPKQVLDWFGQPFVRCVAQTALQAYFDPVIVVTGHQTQQVRQALNGLALQIVHNPDWRAGQSSSVKAGLAAVPQNAGAAIFMMADQPHIPLQLLQALSDAHAADLPAVVAPRVQGQCANPVFFDRCTFPDLAQLSGDSGGRQLFSKYGVHWLPWADAKILLDVDTVEDYQILLESYS